VLNFKVAIECVQHRVGRRRALRRTRKAIGLQTLSPENWTDCATPGMCTRTRLARGVDTTTDLPGERWVTIHIRCDRPAVSRSPGPARRQSR
jgi:hypothetical protein